MKKRNIISIILSFSALLFISGCVNYEQDTFINPDMSGRVELHLFPNPQPAIEAILKKVDPENKLSAGREYDMSKATYKMNVDIKEENLLDGFNQEAIKRKSFRKIEKDGIPHFYLTVEFDDVRKLFEGKKIVTVAEDKKGLITYTEYFKSLKDEKKFGDDDNTPTDSFEGFYFKYTLHMPADIVSANTADIDKNTAVWELPLEAVIKDKDFKITATSKRGAMGPGR